MGNFEVLAEELEGEAEEGLVLGEGLIRDGKREWKDKEHTRIRCVSGFSLEVMWSAMLLWKRDRRATKRAAVGWFDIGGAAW